MTRFIPSHYIVFWSCPVDTAQARKLARRFAKKIRGAAGVGLFSRKLARPSCGAAIISYSRAQDRLDEIRACLPPDGELRVLGVTEAQFGRSQNFWGHMRKIGDAASQETCGAI